MAIALFFLLTIDAFRFSCSCNAAIKALGLRIEETFFTKFIVESKDESSYGFVTPLFYTQDGQVTLIPKQDYAVASNPDVVTKEMTKKELKKFKN